MLLYRDPKNIGSQRVGEGRDGAWNIKEGVAEHKMDFLKDIDDYILEEMEWVVYETDGGIHKGQFIHDGTYEELLEEPEYV